ncbi:MAG TPA: glycosyltransferase [Stellaceae bacterium]|nr:glycosyltransferase [Stellaceae bacterium]
MTANPPKLLFLVTEDWYFWSHRLPMARAARDAGFEVAAATRVTAHGEGLPLSLLEAAACGRPLIATDIPGWREIAKANVNAPLVPVGDIDALAAAIERLVRDDALREQFGNASRAPVDPELSGDRIGAATVALYRRMTGSSC